MSEHRYPTSLNYYVYILEYTLYILEVKDHRHCSAARVYFESTPRTFEFVSLGGSLRIKYSIEVTIAVARMLTSALTFYAFLVCFFYSRCRVFFEGRRLRIPAVSLSNCCIQREFCLQFRSMRSVIYRVGYLLAGFVHCEVYTVLPVEDVATELDMFCLHFRIAISNTGSRKRKTLALWI